MSINVLKTQPNISWFFYQIEQNPNRSSLYIKAEVSAGLRKSWKTSYKNYKAGGPATINQS